MFAGGILGWGTTQVIQPAPTGVGVPVPCANVRSPWDYIMPRSRYRSPRKRTGEITRGPSLFLASLLVLGLVPGKGIQAQENKGISTGPHLLGVFPPGVVIGEDTEVVVRGPKVFATEQFDLSGTGITVRASRPGADDSRILTLRTNPGTVPGYRELRAKGSTGLSNPLILRVDSLPQAREAEPNDTFAQATPVKVDSAVAGTLVSGDLDYYLFEGRAGQKLTVEVEARRLGVPIVPLVTLFKDQGELIDQDKETRGFGEDYRKAFTLPRDGRYFLEVRDLTYGGGTWAHYRLRLGSLPFATAVFPLGGRRGESLSVVLSGGTLTRPIRATVLLPDRLGILDHLQPIDVDGRYIFTPQRLALAETSEIFEEGAAPHESSRTRLSPGDTANGRIDRPGECDRYLVAAKKGERVRVQVVASGLGSWLDSVIKVKDGRGNVLGENDDPAVGAFVSAQAPGASLNDSILDIEPREDGDLLVEVRDRYGEGGPEYAYRLTAAPPAGDFSLALQFSQSEGSNAGAMMKSGQSTPPLPSVGAINVRPSMAFPLNVVIHSEGRLGPVQIHAAGLPPGVSVDPVTVRANRAVGRGSARAAVVATSYVRLWMRIDADAKPGLGVLRLEGASSLGEGRVITRRALLTVPLGIGDVRPPLRTVTRVLEEVPVCVLKKAE